MLWERPRALEIGGPANDCEGFPDFAGLRRISHASRAYGASGAVQPGTEILRQERIGHLFVGLCTTFGIVAGHMAEAKQDIIWGYGSQR